MKILHLRASNFYGGPERQLHYHARLARGTEFEIVIGSYSEGGKKPEFINSIEADGIATKLFDVRGAYDRRAIGLIRDYLRSEKIDILCTHDYRSHILGYWAAKRTGVRWAAFSRGWTKDTIRVRFYTLLEKIFVRFADHIVAVSEAQKSRLTALSISAEKITVVHNAIDMSEIKKAAPVDLRNRFGLPPDAIIVIAGGRFSREKGQIYLVQAAIEALQRNDRLRFILFGDGPDFEKTVGFIRRANMHDKIICPGFEKNLLGYIKGADLLVNPSLSEGLPNIVLEGMALEVPVIATAVGGVPELIADGRNGLLVPAGDTKALADSILKLAKDRSLQSQITLEAVKTLKESYSFEGQMKILADIYQKLKYKK